MSYDDEDTSYDNTHRAFLQAFLARGTLTLEDAKPILAAIQTVHNTERPTLEEDITEADFSNYVSAINSQISPFDYTILSTLDQTSKERIYAIVNTTSDPITQIATVHSADEIAFVKRLLDAIFETYNGSGTGHAPRAEVLAITSMQALKLARPSETDRRQSSTQTQSTAANASLTQSQAEAMLKSLVAEGWFQVSNKGYYTLTPRALMELKGWLVETYNDTAHDDDDDDGNSDSEQLREERIKFCQACKEIVTIGRRCPKLDCNARMHSFCSAGMFRAQGGAERCPVCKTGWQDAPPVGEKAARGAAASRRSTASGVGASSSGGARRRTSRLDMDGANDDDEEDDDAVGGS